MGSRARGRWERRTDNTEVVVRLEAARRWIDQAIDGDTDVETAIDAAERLLAAARSFQAAA